MSEDNVTLQVRKLTFDEETKKASYSYLIQGFKIDDVRSIFSSKRNDGSFILHTSIIKRLNIKSTDTTVNGIKSFIGNQNLRAYKDSVFETALTIYILRDVLVEYKGESHATCERANSWLSEQLGGNKELEKELFEACEQYLVEETVKQLNDDGTTTTTEVVEEINVLNLDVSEETRQTVLNYLQSRTIADDAQVICKTQKSDGSFILHSSIIKTLQIPSIDESVKGLIRYCKSKSLKDSDKSIWETAFVITYFRKVLSDFENEWRNPCEKASKWVSKKKLGESEEKELYSACDQYLLEKAVDVYNNNVNDEEISVRKLEVDEKTRTGIYNGLKSAAKVEDVRSLCKSQSSNGSFPLHEIISKQLDISSAEDAVEYLKSFVGSIRLRRLDKNLWTSALVVTYFRKVLDKHESEWRAACDRASSWISQQVHNAEFEKDLYSACEQVLIEKGCEFVNRQSTSK